VEVSRAATEEKSKAMRLWWREKVVSLFSGSHYGSYIHAVLTARCPWFWSQVEWTGLLLSILVRAGNTVYVFTDVLPEERINYIPEKTQVLSQKESYHF
jgi:hypothetical protein